MHACINVLPLLYPFGLLSCLVYCRWCCCDDWGYMYLLEIVFLFSLVRCPEVKLLDHIVVPFVVFLRSLNIVFHGGCISLLSHWECIRVPFSSYPCKYLLVTVFLMVAILTGVTGYLSVTLIFISLKVGDVECLLAICVSSLERWLF